MVMDRSVSITLIREMIEENSSLDINERKVVPELNQQGKEISKVSSLGGFATFTSVYD